MNSRTISLPELCSEKRRNSTLSLSEGFAGAKWESALHSTSQNFAPKPIGVVKKPGGNHFGDDDAGSELGRVLPIYYRTRQFVLGMEKSNHRVPFRMQSDLRAQEAVLARELRPLHPLLFQRFDEQQMDRLLRSMPFMKLSTSRWIFGGDAIDSPWNSANNTCCFLLLSGRVHLFPDPKGLGETTEIEKGNIFGERRFRLADEGMRDFVACAAQCVEPCILGVLSTGVIESAFADRAFGNRRIQQMMKTVPSLSRIVQPDFKAPVKKDDGKEKSTKDKLQEEKDEMSGAVWHGLRDISTIATTLHVLPGQEVLGDEPLDESILVVSKGTLEVRGDVRLVERLESLPPKKVRIRLFIERAQNLAGDSWLDKLDPYCIVKIGDFKRFQTPVLWNAGPNPRWEYTGVLKYDDEEMIEFTVMDHDKFSADDLCGNGHVPISMLHDGWSGPVQLTQPKKGVYKSEGTLEEPAGRLFISVKWDFEKVTALTRTPKERSFPDQELFTLNQLDCWGHEQIMLQSIFRRSLEQASADLKYALVFGNFRIVGATTTGSNERTTIWKVGKRRFTDFVKHCGREKQFIQACRVSSLEKQQVMKKLAVRLIDRWEQEEMANMLRSGIEEKNKPEQMDPSRFRVCYRGVKAHITVRNALNLQGGGWFDKLDPYAVVRFRGQQRCVKTSVLQDVGSDPVWNSEGSLTYQGETILDVSVYDYDALSADDLLAVGTVPVDQFAGGFEGMIPLSVPGDKKKKNMKAMMIIIGIQWDQPRDPNVSMTQNATATSMSAAMKTLTSGGMQQAIATH